MKPNKTLPCSVAWMSSHGLLTCNSVMSVQFRLTYLADLHVSLFLLVDRDLLTDHLLGLVTDLRRPLVIVTVVSWRRDVSVCLPSPGLTCPPPVAFLPDNLPAVSPPVATEELHHLLGLAAAPVVLHLTLHALHGHQLGLAGLPCRLLQTGGELL